MIARTELQPRNTAASTFVPGRGLLLQRKCACGSPTSSLTGECTECKSNKLLQAKLTIGASNDPLEQEADRIADRVMATPAHSAVSGAAPRIQRYTGQATGQADTAPASVDRVLASPGRPLNPALRQDMEQRFGHDFSRVRVHTDAKATESAQALHARAFTIDNQVVFAEGEYRPTHPEGQRLIAHELTHVLQQRSGLSRGVQLQPDEPPGGDTAIFTEDQRERYRIEVASRIADVARKWSLAISLTYTDEKTRPDEDLWGFIFEALFTFAGGLIGRAVARKLGGSVLALYVKNNAAFKEAGEHVLAEKAYELGNYAAQRVENGFDRVQEALVDGAKEWLDDHASRSSQLGDAKAIATTMSDTVGRWAQNLRGQYIVKLPANAKGDARLIGAFEAFDEQYHPQATYNEKVAEAWRRYREKVIPVLAGQKGFHPVPGHSLANVPTDLRLRSPMYRLRVAKIYLPAHKAERLAVVYEYIASSHTGDVATGEYAFKEWIDPDIESPLASAKTALAEKRTLEVSDLINPADPNLGFWIFNLGFQPPEEKVR